MGFLRVVQFISVLTIALIASAEPAEARVTMFDACTFCDASGNCPENMADLVPQCESQCGAAPTGTTYLPGCVENWGNCVGMRVGCNLTGET